MEKLNAERDVQLDFVPITQILSSEFKSLKFSLPPSGESYSIPGKTEQSTISISLVHLPASPACIVYAPKFEIHEYIEYNQNVLDCFTRDDWVGLSELNDPEMGDPQ